MYHYKSPLGGITLSSDGSSLTGLWFDDQQHFMSTVSSDCKEEALPIFEEASNWLDDYFRGEHPATKLPLVLKGTSFQKEVWEILLSIPYGKTMTYGEITKRIAEKRGIPSMSAQAVGNAVARNPISILVPCHRVIGSNGSLTGYAGGLDRKKRLLELEKAL
ncbi:MAG: methylated-DNA--[Oscillospiraceae bacterium]|nr:methylated-DNA--[protein]-cysteine S-methyltransferase [Oscillospiraceae bacterium]